MSQQPQNAPTYSVAVDLVKIPITVFGPQGNVITDVHSADFRIYEDGKPQEIRSLGRDRNPVSVVLMIDVSNTVEKDLKKIKEGAEGFAQALSPEDQVSVIAFADEAKLLLDWTRDTSQVRKVLRRLDTGLRTNLYDAMLMAAQEQLGGIDGRKAIILLTDFLNNQSVIGYQDAVRAVMQSQASLYIVSKTVMVKEQARTERRVVILNDIYSRLFGDYDYINEFFAKKEAQMSELAERTGGRCYFPSDYNQIRNLYEDVARELKNQYYLTYVSDQFKEDNTYHHIAVEYMPPSSKIIYRQGYFFRPSPIFHPGFIRRHR